jgi:branched-chain amino acid transport system permease protein
MLGINVWRLRVLAMAFAGLSAGMGGVLFIPTGVLDFSLWLPFTLFGFVAAAVAGYHSFWWTFLASLGFGIVSEMGTAYISSVFSQAIAFGILAVAVLVGQRATALRILA